MNMCNFNIPIPDPREIAKNFLKHNGYEDGSLVPIEQYNNLYSGCSHYGAGIGLHVAGKKYGQDKIVVEIGMDEKNVHVFSLRDIYKEVLEEIQMQKMGMQQLSLI